MSRRTGPYALKALPGTPDIPALSGGFLASVQTLSSAGRMAASLAPSVRRWLEPLADERKDFPDWSGIRDERDEPGVATAVGALERKLLPHPRQQLRPGNA